jgi:hypothetical protein
LKVPKESEVDEEEESGKDDDDDDDDGVEAEEGVDWIRRDGVLDLDSFESSGARFGEGLLD